MERLAKFVASASILALSASAAGAGGFARGTADTDLLYEPENFDMRVGVTAVLPSQKFSANVNAALIGTNLYGNYVIPSGAVKFNVSDNLRCVGTYTQSTGADVEYESPKFPSGKLSEKFATDEFGATCAVRFAVGPGTFSVLGGGFVEELDYDRLTSLVYLGLPAGTTADLKLKGQEYGWRAGLAYEIPEYALRAQLMYRSGTDYGAEGTLSVPGALVGSPAPVVDLPASALGNLPQSVELKLQTGVAPNWLVYTNVKWTDWSVLQTLTVTSPLSTQVDQYQWKDGWTITGGVGHKFTDDITGLVGLTWDRGVSSGWDLKSDVWTLALGASFKDKIGGEFRGGVGFSYLASTQETQYANAIIPGSIHSGFNQALDSGYAISANAGYVLHW